MIDRRRLAIGLGAMALGALISDVEFESKSMTDYGRRLRGLVRGLWNGSIDTFTFVDSVRDALARAFEQAWTEGARSEGIEPSERSPEEQARLDEMIFEQSGYIPGLADYVNQHLKVDGEKLGTAQARIPMWTNRYQEVKTQAQVMAGLDKKYVWTLGPTEHCSTCLKLAGKVKRGSYWQQMIMPQDSRLECGGFRCQCSLQPTSDPLSRGPLPSIP